MEKVVIVYHASCVDGFTSAWLLAFLYPDAEFIAAQYQSTLFDDLAQFEGASVFFVDFSLPKEKLEAIEAVSAFTLVYDHHESAAEQLTGLSWCDFDQSECGASLVLDRYRSRLLISQKLTPGMMVLVEQFVAYVKDHDLWEFGLLESKAVRLYFKSVEFDFAAWTTLCFEGPSEWIAKGKPILSYQKMLVENHLNHVREFKLASKPVLGVPCTGGSPLISEIGNALALKSESSVGCCWFDTVEGTRVYSLRSVGEGNALAIARYYGGGGHRHACGFSIPIPS